MAKTIKNVKIIISSSDTVFTDENAMVEYRVTDGDLSKRERLVVSGLNTAQNVPDYWDDIITEVNTKEGL